MSHLNSPRSFFGVLTLSLVALILAGCSQETPSTRAFVLPQGDPEEGQLVFLEYQCIDCHSLARTEQVGNEASRGQNQSPRSLNVMLGGASVRVQTQADLVTSIINPSHRIASGYAKEALTYADGSSKMITINDQITVTELIDLVAFLQTEYELITPPMVNYPSYIYPQ